MSGCHNRQISPQTSSTSQGDLLVMLGDLGYHDMKPIEGVMILLGWNGPTTHMYTMQDGCVWTENNFFIVFLSHS